MVAARGFTICGTDEIGMSTNDIVTVGGALGNLSKFPQVADRLQQGLLNELFLGRLMIHPDGLVSKAAFRIDPEAADPAPVPGGNGNAIVPENSTLEKAIVTGPDVRAWYRGISQGGIMGGALMALAPDSTIGTDPPPLTNTAPAAGEDPHELPRVSDTAVEMIDSFLREGGAVTNPCAPGPCLAGGWTGS